MDHPRWPVRVSCISDWNELFLCFLEFSLSSQTISALDRRLLFSFFAFSFSSLSLLQIV
jgi:hypothetical protein